MKYSTTFKPPYDSYLLKKKPISFTSNTEEILNSNLSYFTFLNIISEFWFPPTTFWLNLTSNVNYWHFCQNYEAKKLKSQNWSKYSNFKIFVCLNCGTNPLPYWVFVNSPSPRMFVTIHVYSVWHLEAASLTEVKRALSKKLFEQYSILWHSSSWRLITFRSLLLWYSETCCCSQMEQELNGVFSEEHVER